MGTAHERRPGIGDAGRARLGEHRGARRRHARARGGCPSRIGRRVGGEPVDGELGQRPRMPDRLQEGTCALRFLGNEVAQIPAARPARPKEWHRPGRSRPAAPGRGRACPRSRWRAAVTRRTRPGGRPARSAAGRSARSDRRRRACARARSRAPRSSRTRRSRRAAPRAGRPRSSRRRTRGSARRWAPAAHRIRRSRPRDTATAVRNETQRPRIARSCATAFSCVPGFERATSSSTATWSRADDDCVGHARGHGVRLLARESEHEVGGRFARRAAPRPRRGSSSRTATAVGRGARGDRARSRRG